jgi:sugar/nucleoside kinase (ribokinase family)
MSQRRGILAGGNWIVDRLKVIDTYPREEALANILSESVGNGGSPFNILMDLARLKVGLPLAGVGLIGDDAEGRWIISQCAAHGIDASQLHVHPGARTSYTDVMTVKETGRRTFFHQRGANAHLDDVHFDFNDNQARHFHLGYLLLLDALDRPDDELGTVAARVLRRAQEAGLTTSIDVVSEDSARFASVVLPALPYVDYCIVNEFELERITGVKVRRDDNVNFDALRSAAERLLDAGVREWAVVHFPDGACALGKAGQLHYQRSLKIPSAYVVSTVGAGDAFTAGVLYALHERQPIEVALRYGVCVAASSLHGGGASDAVGILQDCLMLEERFGVRA